MTGRVQQIHVSHLFYHLLWKAKKALKTGHGRIHKVSPPFPPRRCSSTKSAVSSSCRDGDRRALTRALIVRYFTAFNVSLRYPSGPSLTRSGLFSKSSREVLFTSRTVPISLHLLLTGRRIFIISGRLNLFIALSVNRTIASVSTGVQVYLSPR